jgi:hypothetical protein
VKSLRREVDGTFALAIFFFQNGVQRQPEGHEGKCALPGCFGLHSGVVFGSLLPA